ncbi:DUF4402 domain-containing protein [Sphingobium boeckii]|uniref:DUF4402 domain-containing protein n=1 Tax=Sphingobium boeckii TaxID=1082345 RepID=A0A7W9AFF1_9SPHN|nr:DUF4402 domain-containing protein [Sphingobium boeckii]MBB5684583.1 hypothetical protein [Sphingobium boeckii]
MAFTDTLANKAIDWSGLALRSACLIALIGLPGHGFAKTGNGDAVVITVKPLSLLKTADLDFGDVAVGGTPGTVTINPTTGARTTAGGVTAIGGTPNGAQFVGAAAIGILVVVGISAAPTLTRAGGGSMTSTLNVEGGTGIRLFPGTGLQTFRVGGTLNVGANQLPGAYSGNFTLTVNYL